MTFGGWASGANEVFWGHRNKLCLFTISLRLPRARPFPPAIIDQCRVRVPACLSVTIILYHRFSSLCHCGSAYNYNGTRCAPIVVSIIVGRRTHIQRLAAEFTYRSSHLGLFQVYEVSLSRLPCGTHTCTKYSDLGRRCTVCSSVV